MDHPLKQLNDENNHRDPTWMVPILSIILSSLLFYDPITSCCRQIEYGVNPFRPWGTYHLTNPLAHNNQNTPDSKDIVPRDYFIPLEDPLMRLEKSYQLHLLKDTTMHQLK